MIWDVNEYFGSITRFTICIKIKIKLIGLISTDSLRYNLRYNNLITCIKSHYRTV
jgi:hypothetical protein